jgi:Na+-driven multidrug efflux pump
MAQSLQATLIEGQVPQQLKNMAVPMVWGLMATMSLNAVDTFFIAQVGREPLAALSFTFPVIMGADQPWHWLGGRHLIGCSTSNRRR